MEKRRFCIAVIMMVLVLLVAGGSVGYAVEKVNINTASAEELKTLKYVGEKTASAIIAYREAHSGFGSPEEITQVKGVGERTFEINKDFIVVKDE